MTDSDDNPLVPGVSYKITGKRNGNDQETTFFATFNEQTSGLYIKIETEPNNYFYQYFSDIRSIKRATFLDRFLYKNFNYL